MSTTNPFINKDQLSSLYASGKSMKSISKELGCSENKIVYWMERYGIPRRTRNEAAYLYFNPDGDPFKIKENLSPDEKFLLGLALGIYWGEGTKTTPHSLKVTNTDPKMLRVFINFLKQICQLNPNKLLYNVVCFNDTDPETARKYWAKELKTLPEKFGKITTIPTQGKGTYHRKSKFGVCMVCVGNIKLKTWIMSQIAKLDSLPG